MSSKVIFTNGCFDILHRGHIELLRYCRSLGDKVIVGINSDESVKRLKGDQRPIFSQKDTPYNLMKKVRPDVIVKGGDYNEEDVVGNDLCQVRIFEYVPGYSTTKTIQDSGGG